MKKKKSFLRKKKIKNNNNNKKKKVCIFCQIVLTIKNKLSCTYEPRWPSNFGKSANFIGGFSSSNAQPFYKKGKTLKNYKEKMYGKNF